MRVRTLVIAGLVLTSTGACLAAWLILSGALAEQDAPVPVDPAAAGVWDVIAEATAITRAAAAPRGGP